MRAPRVARGQRLTAELWNRLADAVDGAKNAPMDTDAGLTQEEADELAGGVRLVAVSYTSDTVRITNPEDETQYVDVDRIDTITWRNTRTGEVEVRDYP